MEGSALHIFSTSPPRAVYPYIPPGASLVPTELSMDQFSSMIMQNMARKSLCKIVVRTAVGSRRGTEEGGGGERFPFRQQ